MLDKCKKSDCNQLAQLEPDKSEEFRHFYHNDKFGKTVQAVARPMKVIDSGLCYYHEKRRVGLIKKPN